MKEQAIGNHDISKFHAYNKVLVKSCTHFHHKCWKRRNAVLHGPKVQQKALKEEAEVIIEEANKEEIEGLRRCTQAHATKSNALTTEEMFFMGAKFYSFQKKGSKR